MKEIVKECRKVWPFITDKGDYFIIHYGNYESNISYSKKYKLFYMNGRFLGITKPSYKSFETLIKALKLRFQSPSDSYLVKLSKLEGYNNVHYIENITTSYIK